MRAALRPPGSSRHARRPSPRIAFAYHAERTREQGEDRLSVDFGEPLLAGEGETARRAVDRRGSPTPVGHPPEAAYDVGLVPSVLATPGLSPFDT